MEIAPRGGGQRGDLRERTRQRQRPGVPPDQPTPPLPWPSPRT